MLEISTSPFQKEKKAQAQQHSHDNVKLDRLKALAW